jgi:hypothetical protein
MSWDPRSGAPGQTPTPSPFGPPPFSDPYARPPKSSSAGWLLAIGGGGILLLVLLCCGGGYGGFVLVANVLSAEIKEMLRDNPTLREHVGELESVELDFFGSMAIDDDDTFRYRVKGSKASGELTVKQHTDDDGDEVIEEASLRLPGGEQVQIVP